MCILEIVITADSVSDKWHIKHDAPVVYLLIKGVIYPLAIGNGELGNLRLYAHFGFNIALVVCLEGCPSVGSVLRVMPDYLPFAVLGRGAEIANQVFAFFQFLLFKIQRGADRIQRQR